MTEEKHNIYKDFISENLFDFFGTVMNFYTKDFIKQFEIPLMF